MKKTSAYARKRGLHQLPSQARTQVLQAIKGTGITVNNLRNTPLKPAEVDKLTQEATEAMEAARKGRISYNDWVSLSSIMHKGVAIEDAGNIITGLRPVYDTAQAAIAAIEARCTTTGRWVPSALYGPELTALDDLLWAYRKALEVCTYGEFYKRQAVACSRTASQGLPVFTTGDVLEYPAK
jgi:hypothetical protein